jgi:hypothetical protein
LPGESSSAGDGTKIDRRCENAFYPRSGDDLFGLTELAHIWGWVTLIPSVFLDILKAPILLTGAAAAAARGSLANAFDHINNPREKVAMELMLESFKQRFFQTLSLLNQLGLETPLSLHLEFASGNITPYMTLTLVFTAFFSRRAPDGHLCLASGKLLSKENCPKQGQALFTLINQIKNDLIVFGITSTPRQDVATETLKNWIPIIKTGLEGSDEMDTLLAQREVNENIKQAFWNFLGTLKQIQEEITDIQISEDQALVLNNAPVRLAQNLRN